MTSTPHAADVFWECDPLPLGPPARPKDGPDASWWRETSKAKLSKGKAA